MEFEEAMLFQEEALTLYDAVEASSIYLLNKNNHGSKFIIVRVDEQFDRDCYLNQGATFHPHHKIMELITAGYPDIEESKLNEILESEKTISVDLEKIYGRKK